MRKFTTICLSIMLLLVTTLAASAQSGKYVVQGVVNDQTGLPVMGAAVIEVGTMNGTATDADGHYTLTVKSAQSVVEVSFFGYKTVQRVASSTDLKQLTLTVDAMALDEVVVIGYGSVKKNDMTGSVIAVKADEKMRPALTSPQEMLRGKIPGVNITTSNGAPGAGAEIRIRGGASLSANNDPLIVIDGVPVAKEAGSGMANGLSTVNPNDIESFTVLKDASATAIYGSRAANGVILITTKKGSGNGIKVSYNGSFSVKQNANTLDLLTASELKDYILSKPMSQTLKDKAVSLMGKCDTDWQNEIYRTALATDHNVSVYGKALNMLPFRVSGGYTYDEGTIKTSDNKHGTLDVSLSPKFLDDHLSVNLNAKGIYNKGDYADGGVVGSAVFFDPSQDLYSRAADGSIDKTVNNGYYNWSNKLAGSSPLSMLYDQWDQNHSYRALGNLQLDYKVHGFEALSFNLNLGLDITSTNGDKGNYPGSIFANRDDSDDGKYQTRGQYTDYTNLHRNQLLEFYADYNKEFGKHSVNAMAGYSWSMNFYSVNNTNYGRTASTDPEVAFVPVVRTDTYDAARNALVSFYGRLNYSYDSRYLFTATMRADGSSRFVGDNRWGYFPSAAFAWNIAQEDFLKSVKPISALKLRLGWGITGQQEFGGDFEKYAALAYGVVSVDPGTQYPLGGGQYYYPVKPHEYNDNLKWEETATYNAGLDFGFFNGRISGSVDAYYRKTSDLLAYINVPLGGNYSNYIWQNIGNMENKGLEMSFNFIPVQTKDWSLNIGLNGTFQNVNVKSLSVGKIDIGGAGGGTGNTAQRHQVGYAPYTFYLWQQVYDENGKPIEGALVDRDGDGQITNADRYMTNKSPNPDFYYGVNLSLTYRNWDFGFSGHGTFGNYMFNDVCRGAALTYFNDIIDKGYLVNTMKASKEYNFTSAAGVAQSLSDLFLENASYFRMDDISLGYTFPKFGLWTRDISMRVAGGVQNVFVITKYKGLDPETSVASGIDSNIYPRPRVFSLRLGINF